MFFELDLTRVQFSKRISSHLQRILYRLCRHQTFSEIGLFFPRWHLVIAATSYNENDSGAPARAKRAPSGEPWVRKFGKLSIPENMVMT